MRAVLLTEVLDEEENLGRLLDRVAGRWPVVVVDDGSADRTAEVARARGAAVVRHCANLGQGAALVTGFMAVLRFFGDREAVVCLDGDGQHDPAEVPRLLAALEETGADIAVGSRILGQNYQNAPFFRRAFLPHYTWLVNRCTGYRLTDAMCGFRAFRLAALRRAAPLLEEMLEPQYIAAEMFIRFARAGLTVAETPITLADRFRGRSRKGFLRYGYGVLKAVAHALLAGRRGGREAP